MENDDGKKFINELYDKRNKLIIIGLTGSTGSGCTTVANLISDDLFNKYLPEPKKECYTNIEERKYKIAHKYFNNHRENFKNDDIYKIEVTDIICSFILEHDYSELEKYIKKIDDDNKEDKKHTINKYEEEILPELKNFKKKFNSIKSNILGEENNFIENLRKNNKLLIEKLKGLKNFKKNLKKILKNTYLYIYQNNKKNSIRRQANLYTCLFQNIGDNIRATGNPYLTVEPEKIQSDPEKIYSIPKRIKEIIDIIDLSEKDKNKLIIIDAIRNPFEVIFFRDKYSNFYLFNVSKTDKERKEALIKKGLCTEEIEDIEKRELIKMKYKDYYKVNVLKCIDLSDIHIFNPGDKNNYKKNYKENIKKNLVRYLALIMHPGLVTPTDVERCMKIANDLRVNSGCLSLQVGAIVTDDSYNIISTGWNTVPNGQIPCNLRNIENFINEDDEVSFSKYELEDENFNNYIKLQYYLNIDEKLDKHYIPQYCFKDAYHCFTSERNQVHTKAIHAEEMALLKGVVKEFKNGKLFTTSKTCELCAKKTYQAGIKEIYYINQYSGISEDNIINCGTNQPELKIFDGITGLAYDKLYTRLIAYDEEQYALTGFSFKESMQNMFVKLKVNGNYIYVEDKDKKNKFLKKADNPNSFDIFEIKFDDKMLVLINAEKYVCTDLAEDNKLNANTNGIQTWEKFKIKFLIRPKEFTLQSLANNKFIKLDNGYLKANEESIDEYDKDMIFEFEKFKLPDKIEAGKFKEILEKLKELNNKQLKDEEEILTTNYKINKDFYVLKENIKPEIEQKILHLLSKTGYRNVR